MVVNLFFLGHMAVRITIIIIINKNNNDSSNNPTFVPAKDWHHSNNETCRPGECDGCDGGLRRAVAAVVVGVSDGIEALEGNDEETEDGDLGEDDDAGVDDEATDEVRRKTVESNDDTGNAYNAVAEDGEDAEAGRWRMMQMLRMVEIKRVI